MPTMHPVKSSNVKEIGHDADTNELHVTFRNGATYVYHGVAPEQFAQLKAAPSVGGHLNKHIKSKHPWRKHDADH